MAGRVEGRVVVVSGAARGMGAADARLLAAEGARVLLGDLLADEGRALAQELGKEFGPDAVRFQPLDVASEESWQQAVGAAEREFGAPVSGLVNNAGIVHVDPIAELSEADYRRVIDVNQVGVFLGMKSVLPSMRRAGGGSIVNISSVGHLPIPREARPEELAPMVLFLLSEESSYCTGGEFTVDGGYTTF